MNVYEARLELRRMNKSDLFKLASNQRISRCLIGGTPCGFYLHYKGFHFCISEILGEKCQLEGAEKFIDRYESLKETNGQLSLMERPETGPFGEEKRIFEFKVYSRDRLTHSINHLGMVLERRRKERGNNLKDLLVKAMKDYSDCVADPSTIFLLSS